MAGATVRKVESVQRPDGARRGPSAFFDLLNAGKESVAVDLATADGVAHLAAVIDVADVVIEGSRPRALEHLGIDAVSRVDAGGPRVWLSITGHGRDGAARDWVAFGDDAAVAGGLVAEDETGPVFCADAVADPLTGVASAVAVLEALAAGERGLLDASLSAVAAAVAGPTLLVPDGVVAAAPVARTPIGPGPALKATGV
jgi:crotonobetainyl-CoA:carnitine CoA-transferase CaiB-like acyl-CoA transferase